MGAFIGGIIVAVIVCFLILWLIGEVMTSGQAPTPPPPAPFVSAESAALAAAEAEASRLWDNAREEVIQYGHDIDAQLATTLYDLVDRVVEERRECGEDVDRSMYDNAKRA